MVLNTRAEKRRAEHRSPGPRQRHSQPHILAMSCPSAGTLGRCEGCTQSMQATSPDYRHSDCGIYCAGGYIQVTVHPGQLLHPGQHSPRKTHAHGLKGCTCCWVETWLNGWAQIVMLNLNPAGGWSPVVSPGLSFGARPVFVLQDSKQRKSMSSSHV